MTEGSRAPVAPVQVGLVGAGPWAELVHAPTLAAGPDTALAGIWARRPDAAEALAARHGTKAFPTFEHLVVACEAVAFAVPPAVQAVLACTAARAGRSLLLEKPLAEDLDGARRLVDAVEESGVGSQMVLTWRYAEGVRRFVDDAASIRPFGGRALFASGALLGGRFATPWRLRHGALLDLGPHMVDLLDAALGPVVDARAHANDHGWVGLLLEHEHGPRSEVSLCATAVGDLPRPNASVFGEDGTMSVDADVITSDVFAVATREFAETVRRRGGHPLDARRGLHLQQVLATATADLRRGEVQRGATGSSSGSP